MFWSNLFKKKNKIFNTEIVNNSSSIIPSLEELTIVEQEYVNKLKEEYLKAKTNMLKNELISEYISIQNNVNLLSLQINNRIKNIFSYWVSKKCQHFVFL